MNELMQNIVVEARKLLGVRWAHQQRNTDAADCAGFAVVVGRAVGLNPIDVSNYPRMPDGTLLPILNQQARRVPVSTMGPGNLVVFDFGEGPGHIGIIADYLHGGLSVIHSDNHPGVRRVVEHRLVDSLKRKIVAAYEPRVSDAEMP